MSKKELPTTKIGEILYEEFMLPLNISIANLSEKINVPTSRVTNIL